MDKVLILGNKDDRNVSKQNIINDTTTPDPTDGSNSIATLMVFLMTSPDGNIFHVTGLLCVEFTGHRWIPRTKASDAELWYFLSFAPEPTVEPTMDTLVH